MPPTSSPAWHRAKLEDRLDQLAPQVVRVRRWAASGLDGTPQDSEALRYVLTLLARALEHREGAGEVPPLPGGVRIAD